MSRYVLVDTSAWIARAARSEDRHAEVIAAMDTTPLRLLTTSYVLDETVTLARQRYDHRTAVRLGQGLLAQTAVEMHRISAEDEKGAFRLFQNCPDKHYSFTDCTSFVVMGRLGIDTVVTLDEDFRREGFTVLP